MVYVNTREEAIVARRQLRAEGYMASYGKATGWAGYNVAGWRYCFCWHKIKAALRKRKENTTP
jgi:hypothetical protein